MLAPLNYDQFIEQDSVIEKVLKEFDREYFYAGKKLRSQMIALIATSYGLSPAVKNTLCLVTEWVHTASLIHDDVIDEATLRRGLSSLNHFIGNKRAVLVGDFLLSHSMKQISLLNNISLVQSISQTVCDLVEGELIQDELNSKSKKDWTLESYFKMAKHKTGSLFSWTLGCCFRALDEKLQRNIEVDKIESIGLELGVLFQMKDDLLDFLDETSASKGQMKDLDNGNINYLLCLYNKIDSRSELKKLAHIHLQKDVELKSKKLLKRIESLTIKQDLKDLLSEMIRSYFFHK